MQQFVKWDFITNSVIRGPQANRPEDDNWYSLIEAGKVTNPKTQKAIYTFSPELQAVVITVEGSPKPTYAQARESEYGSLAKQLDMLWHDINNGTLDQTGQFYQHIKNIKENNPK